ncbi:MULTISPECIES: DUF5995 family protein [unclassified Streptomyces]|uniref:DUF5995 family protein n=1 Tax=Streptomyces TaxID=1883 RepID=UPI0001C19066|nr:MULTISPECIES: DUF5995 family protein [unclassified Streptomyces]AEN08796.1 conserved hypothetical protein [Streptomyces sp. SirexAA-E]MYR68709.1 hypothetical protein [Streptomyces sp. SID4939]MYS02999.1 hypothetical protein [Streptomyces sp. SID4940]MYT64115.1 hypothetical protein [Streptomyces sp. SID8357]MYT86900.1 hypothetical protein [Streptomyces sp. SID8360]
MDRFEQCAVPAVPGGPAADVGTVIARMRAYRSRWPPQDGVAVFNQVYLTVTEAVGGRIADGSFADPQAVSVLDVRFAELYLTAVETEASGGRAPDCWRALFAYRRHPGVRPLQFALAGINAHIGHDLALAVVDTCRALDCAPEDLEGEFRRVGDLLVTLEEEIREDLMPGPDLLEIADPLTHLASTWSLERAREASWAAARVLWRLRGVPPLAEEFRTRMDAGVGLVGRLLLTPCR